MGAQPQTDSEDLSVRSVTALPAEIAVGAGTALFLDGVCSASPSVRSLTVVFGGVAHEAMGWEMAEPGGRVGGGYWWAVIPIGALADPLEVEIEVVAELDDGSQVRAPLGSVGLRPARRGPSPQPSPPIPPGSEPLVAICMATYEPPLELFRAQIESIKAQTHGRWLCLISDDCSDPASVAAMREVIGPDPRFHLSRAEGNRGHYSNFERSLMMVPDEARFVAFSDQDDVWYPDKLAALIAGLSAGSPLVYADMRLVGEDGTVLADTYWTVRRNNHTDFASIVLANTVTGAGCLFEASLLERALPFPPRHSALFHDHWIAQVAMAVGPLSYVDRPLHDYVQHGDAALGHAAANGGGRFGGTLPQRIRAALHNLREQGYRPAWRAPYFNVFCRVLLTSYVLRARCADLLTPAQTATLDRISDSPRGIAWLLARSARELWGADETIGRERAILAGFAWRRAAVLRRAARERLRAGRTVSR